MAALAHILCCILCFFELIPAGEASVAYADVKSDYEKLLGAYQTADSVGLQQIIPKESLNDAITVLLGINIYAIMDFDSVNGRITLIGSLTTEWRDEIKTLTGTTFTGSLETILINYDKIWNPNLVLMNDAVSIQKIGDIAYKVRYNTSSGWCSWQPRLIINAACTPDMTYYPFDEQKCPLTVTPWFRDQTKITLSTLSNSWNTEDLDKSGIWSVDSTSSLAYTTDGKPFVDFTIVIKRKPLFLSIVIVLPVLLLSLLTGFLFLLPPGSGERTGFGITCFLSFVVILQVLMQFMPESSVPMSILCYYIITMLMFSAGLSIVNMLILRMYLSPSSDKIPSWLVALVKIARCIPCRLLYRRCQCRKKLKSCCRRCCDKIILPACRFCRKSVCTCWEKYGRCQCCCHKKAANHDFIKNMKFNFANLPAAWLQEKQEVNKGPLSFDSQQVHKATSSGLRSRMSTRSSRILPFPNVQETFNKDQKLHSDSERPGTNSLSKSDSVPNADDLDNESILSEEEKVKHDSEKDIVSTKNEPNGVLSNNEINSADAEKPQNKDTTSDNNQDSISETINLNRKESYTTEQVITDDEDEVDEVENTPAFIAGLTWELIARILDVFFIVVFVSVQTVFTFFFLVPLFARY